MIDAELQRKSVLQEGEVVEFEVKEAIPSILYLGRKFSKEAVNVTGPLVSELFIYFFYYRCFPLNLQQVLE